MSKTHDVPAVSELRLVVTAQEAASPQEAEVDGGAAAMPERRLLIKPAEAARCLCISPRTLWQLTNCKAIPCVRIGRSLRYDPRDLENWINEQKGVRRHAQPSRGAGLMRSMAVSKA